MTTLADLEFGVIHSLEEDNVVPVDLEGTGCGMVEGCVGGMPGITALSPPSVNAGATAFLLTVTGVNFQPDSEIIFNGNTLTTTYVSGTELTAMVPATYVELIETVNVVVNNPSPGCGESSAFPFDITESCSGPLFYGGWFGFRLDTASSPSYSGPWGTGSAGYAEGGSGGTTEITPAPYTGYLSNLYLHISTNQPASVTSTLTAYQGSQQTPLAVTVPPSSVVGTFSDIVDVILVKQAERFGFELTVTGGSASPIRNVSGIFSGIDGSSVIGWGGKNATVAGSTTTYLSPGADIQGATEAAFQLKIKFACTILRLFINLNSNQPASGNLVVTVRKNGVATALTRTIPLSGTGTLYGDPNDSFTAVPGDLISIQVVNNATTASAQIAGVTLSILPTTGYTSIVTAWANTTMTGTETYYYNIFSDLETAPANNDLIAFVCPGPGTLQDFQVYGGTNGNSGSQIVWQLYKNGSATGYTKTLGGNMAEGWYNADGGSPVQVAAGDLIWVEVSHTGSGTDPIGGVMFTLVPLIP